MTEQNWGHAAFNVHRYDGTVGRIIVSGRERWALECLIAASAKGCTPIDQPGPRWSAYVLDLRGMGVEIETIREPHPGPFEGTHARYVLQSQVTRAEGGAL
jgi:hypothetical protein